MKDTTTEKEIKILRLEELTMISPWETFEDLGKVWKERRPLTNEYLQDVSIWMQDIDVATSRCHDEGPTQKVIFDLKFISDF